MSIEGTYNLEVSTPMGKQKGKFTFKVEGESLSGSVTNPFGTDNFTGGKVNGDEFEFVFDGKTPFGPAKFEVKGMVSGDKISGEMTMRPMGMKSKFEGTRE